MSTLFDPPSSHEPPSPAAPATPIEAAIALSWSNGQTEGQICKLKLVKRQMYGRGNLDLLQARVMGLG